MLDPNDPITVALIRKCGLKTCLESHRPFISYRTYRRLSADPNMTYDAKKPIGAAGRENL
jgi:hypothetical protein